jgi:diguanylate cyclase (GGDEF)-like protein
MGEEQVDGKARYVRLRERLARRTEMVRRLRELIRSNSVVSASLEREKVLRTILDQTRAVMGCERSSILEVDPAAKQLFFSCFTNQEERDALCNVRLGLGEGIAGQVWEHGKAMLIADARRDSRFSADADANTEFVTTSLVAVPLVVGGRIIGVMEAINPLDGRRFNRFDLEILDYLSVQAAAAIENAQLYAMAITDGLTRLFIHRYFQQRLEEECNRVQRYGGGLSLVIFDLDHFKRCNDTYGHQAGDEVLIRTAALLRKVCRGADVPCRYGGEELAVILPNSGPEEAMVMAERFRAAVEGLEVEYRDALIRVTVSGGLASCGEGGVIDRAGLIRIADEALYRAKDSGRNRVLAGPGSPVSPSRP